MSRLLLAVALCIISAQALAAIPGVPDGEWRYAGGGSETATMERTVDAIVDEMSFVIRPIARPRLKKECSAWTKLRIERDGTDVTITTNQSSFTTTLGKTVRRKGDDGMVNVKRELRDGVLVEKIWSDSGSRTNAFYRREDGVRVASTIAAPRLPKPIVFRYTYK